jgi:hypothetical protein
MAGDVSSMLRLKHVILDFWIELSSGRLAQCSNVAHRIASLAIRLLASRQPAVC